MELEDTLEVGLKGLFDIPTFQSFWDEFYKNKKIKSFPHLLELCNEFQTYLLKEQLLDDNRRINIAIVREQVYKILFKDSKSKIHLIDHSLKIKDEWIIEFRKGLEDCLTGDSTFEEIRPRRFSTIKEMIQLQGVNGKKLTSLYKEYESKNHPFVNYQIGSILLKSKDIENGLPFLKEAIKVGFTFPNYYWHNETAIEGIGQSIGLLLELLGLNGVEKANQLSQGLGIKILKFYFLYSSRYIYMTNSNLKSIDFYSNRARMQKAFLQYFIGIYPLGVNPDIQFISDMYLAHTAGLKNGLTMHVKPFDQFYWEATKMYRYASHIPSDSEGYIVAEEKNMMECVKVGELRSIKLANELYEEFIAYNFKISREEIQLIENYLKEILEHNPQKFIEKMKNIRN